jgi:endo-1,4-beta-xylanase
MFRSGKKFSKYDKTHGQLGNISLQFDATFHSEGCTYLCVYGWTVDPLIEWYIVECYSSFSPPGDLISLGTFDVDGGTYENFRSTRINQPTILGIGTFDQYWSIRTSGRYNGTENVSAHLRAWEDMGLKLGNLTEISLSIECWKSSGSAVINTNILSITDGE